METRAGKFGRFGADLFRYIVGTIPDSFREEYVRRFFVEYMNYSDVVRKKGEPRNEGCVMELDGLEGLDILNPESLAKWFKEGLHLKYQKRTSGNERKGFLS